MPGFELTEDELKVFLQEAYEQLEVLEQGLLSFEQDAHNMDWVQEIFRAAHTLKGGAGAAGFLGMERLTHVLESLLDEVRAGRRPVTVSLVDHMLEAVDLLRDALAAIESEGTTGRIDFDDLCDRLHQMLQSGHEGESEQSMPSSLSEPVTGEEQTLSQHVEQALQWTIRVRSDAPMPSIRLYQALLILEEAGEVDYVHPTAELLEAEDGHQKLTAVILHHQSPETVQAALQEVSELESIEWSPVAATIETSPRNPTEATPDESTKPTNPARDPASSRPAVGSTGVHGALAQTVRVDVALLDRLMNLVGELVIDRTRLHRLVSLDADAATLQEELEQVGGHLSRITTDLQESIMRARMIPLETLFRKFPRLIRDASHQSGKQVEFTISGEETELDRSVIEQIGDPLMHLLRNAVDHGLEPPAQRVSAGKRPEGRVALTAYHRENHIFIEVSDDGRGIDPQAVLQSALEKGFTSDEEAKNLSEAEVLELIMAPGFTTAKEVSSLSGRGVGLDVVRKNIEGVNGHITVESQVGKGTTWRIKLPLTLAIVQALLVQIRGGVYAIPISSVTEALRSWESEIEEAHGWQMIRVRDQVMPLINPADVWGEMYRVNWKHAEPMPVVVLQAGAAPMALLVDGLLGEQEVVIKSLDPLVRDVPGISGASILGDGSVSLIIDVVGLAKEVRRGATRQ